MAFGLVVGIGNGFGYSVPMPVASKWFPDKRGLVVGLMVGGYGAGSAIFGPVQPLGELRTINGQRGRTEPRCARASC